MLVPYKKCECSFVRNLKVWMACNTYTYTYKDLDFREPLATTNGVKKNDGYYGWALRGWTARA